MGDRHGGLIFVGKARVAGKKKDFVACKL